MLKPYFLLICSCLFLQFAKAQDPNPLRLLSAVTIKTRFAEIDRLQQLYLVLDDHTLQKYSPDGKLLKTFNVNSLGPISTVDVANPFQPLLYYSEYQTAIVLDRSLSEMYRFRLSDLNLVQVDAVGMSSDNQLWLYDPNSFLLRKIDAHGEVTQESPDLSAILTDAFLPKQLLEREYQIFLNDPDYGLMIFDNFGNYNRTLQILGLTYFQVLHGQLVWLDEAQRLHRYQLKTFQEEVTDLKLLGIETAGLLQACWAAERLCLRYADKVLWYEWK